MTTKAVRFWDRVSKLSRVPEPLGPTASQTLAAAQPYLSAESRVLDVGCGTGSLTVAIARHVASVHAIDSAAGMVAATQANAASQRTLNVQAAQGELADWAADGETFSMVTMFNVLHYIHDVPEAARQVEKRLLPGGLFLSATACLGERRSFIRGLTWLLRRLRIMPGMHIFKQAELTALIEQGGFQVVAVTRLSSLPEYFIVARKVA